VFEEVFKGAFIGKGFENAITANKQELIFFEMK